MAEQAYAYVTLIPVAKGFQRSIAKELGGIDGVGSSVGKTTGANFKSGFEKAVKGAFKVVAVSAAAATAALGGVLASGFSRLSGIEEAQAKLKGLGNSTENVAIIMDNALSAVRGTAFGMADAATIAASAVAAGIEPGKELADYLKVTADAAYIAGVGLDQMGAILNKTVTSGKAQNDVLGQLAETGIPVYQMLGEQAGVAAGEIFDMASEGLISSEMLRTALATNLGGAAMESGQTVAGAFANMKASIQRVGANLLGPSFGYFKDFFLGLTELLAPIEEKAKVVGQAVADFLGEKIIPYFKDLFLIGTTLGADNVFLKIFNDIRDAVAKFVGEGGIQRAFEKMAEFRIKILEAILEALPGILEAFVTFLPVLVDFFINTMLPTLLKQMEIIIELLVDTVVELLPTLVKTLVGMIPALVTAALDLFKSLVDALIEITPILIDAVLEILPMLIDTLIDMIPELIDAAFTLFAGITQGLIDATPDIVDAVIELVPKLVMGLIDNLPKLVEAGIEIVKGLVRGVVDNAPRLLGNAISALGGGLVNGFKDLLGIRSPSLVFQEFGVNIGEGLAIGMESQRAEVEASAKSLGGSAKKGLADSIEEITEQFTVITNIPSLLQENFIKAADITRSMVRKMAEEIEGFYAMFDENDNLLSVYTGYQVAQNVPTASGGSVDVGRIIDTANSLTGAGADFEAAIGGSLQQVFDTLTKGETFTNQRTGLELSIDELTRVLEDLATGVEAKGLTPFAKGGLVTGPTQALIGEAGPEVVIPLNKFESMMGLAGDKGKSLNYYAAPNNSVDNEQALFQAMRRAKVVANW